MELVNGRIQRFGKGNVRFPLQAYKKLLAFDSAPRTGKM